MRISSGYQFDTYGRDIADAQQRLFDASRQMGTGKRINTLSDDPYGGARSVKMRSLQSAINQYGENLKTAKGTLGYTEGTLSEVSTLLNRASAIAVSGANGATDQKGRDAMAAEIIQMQARLVDLANTKGPNGSYIFAGQKSNTKPYNVAGSTITFNGDTNPTMSEVGPGEMMTVSTPGEPMFSDLYNRLEGLKTNLVGGNTGAISGIDIANVQASQAAISSARGNLGSKLKQVDDLSAQWTRRSDDLTQSISDVEDVDITEAMLKYQQANQAYTAALTVASQGFRLSLMDFIKG